MPIARPLLLIAALAPACAGCESSTAQPTAASPEPVASVPGGSPAPDEPAARAATEPPTESPVEAAETAPAAAVQDISFDDLKFEMEKTEPFQRSMLTPQIEALVGQPIRIRGYIRPTPFQTGITQFVLVRDNMECCFGPGAWLYDCVLVEMSPGKSTDYTVRPVAVEGRFEVREFLGPDGKHLAIYHLQGEKVQ